MNPFIQTLFISAIPLVFAITVHEAAHGYIANKLGDNTAKMMGRVTLNPIKHIDPVGTILLPMIMLYLGGFIFGWAKPVPINWQNLKNPKRDAAFVAIAGPLSNLIMIFIWALIAKLILVISGNTLLNNPGFIDVKTILYAAAQFGIMINCALMILNLIPIPPLDGSRVVSSFLPNRISNYYNSIEPYGIWILLVLFFVGFVQRILLPTMQFCIELISNWFGLIRIF